MRPVANSPVQFSTNKRKQLKEKRVCDLSIELFRADLHVPLMFASRQRLFPDIISMQQENKVERNNGASSCHSLSLWHYAVNSRSHCSKSKRNRSPAL